MNLRTANILLILLLSCCNSSEAIDTEPTVPLAIARGTPINPDGTVTLDEWSDAIIVYVPAAGRESIEISIKHDGENLLFKLELNNPGVSSVLFPEIFIDSDNGRSATWNQDDWWFHISGSDCESKGAPDSYANCMIEQPDWKAVPNYPTDTPGIINTIEVSIPFSKTGVTPEKEFGLALLFTNMSSLNILWPNNAAKLKPSTWQTVILKN
jgi:hypothetical protein